MSDQAKNDVTVSFLEAFEKFLKQLEKMFQIKKEEEQDKDDKEKFKKVVNENPESVKDELKKAIEKETGLKLPEPVPTLKLGEGLANGQHELVIQKTDSKDLTHNNDQKSREDFVSFLKDNPYKTRELMNQFVERQFEKDPEKYREIKTMLSNSYEQSRQNLETQKDAQTKAQFVAAIKQNPENVKQMFQQFLKEDFQNKYQAYKEYNEGQANRAKELMDKLNDKNSEAYQTLRSMEKMYTQAVHNMDINFDKNLKVSPDKKELLYKVKNVIEKGETKERQEEQTKEKMEKDKKDREKDRVKERESKQLQLER